MLAVLYCRVSTEEQGKHGFSLPEQRRECWAKAEALAAERGAALEVREFIDQASGEILERPGLEACRRFLAEHSVACFVCLDPDRFSRSLNLQLLIADEIESRGTDLVFVSHEYRKSPEGKLFFQLRGAISEFEKAKILERTRRGRRGKLAMGGIPNRIATWGYQWNTIAKRLDVDPEAAAWVRRIFAWYVDGWSYARIAQELTDLGVQPPRAAAWHRTTIMRMLRNSTYAGSLVLNRWDCEGNGPLRSIPRERRTRPRTDRLKPASAWVRVPVPAIITQELWERVASLHTKRTRPAHRGVGLLSGLGACGLCGAPLHYMGTPDRRYLRCANRYTGPCPWRDLRAEPIQRAVWEQLCRWLQGAGALTAEQKRQTQAQAARVPNEAAERLATLEQAWRARLEEQRRTYHLFTRGLAPDGAETDLERLAHQVRHLEQAVAAARQALQTSRPIEAPTLDGLVRELPRRTKALTGEQQQRLARLLLERVTVWPDGRFTFSCR